MWQAILAITGGVLGFALYILIVVSNPELMEAFFLPIMVVGVPLFIGWIVGQAIDDDREDKKRRQRHAEFIENLRSYKK